MHGRTLVPGIALAILSVLHASPAPDPAKAAFEKLCSLVGDWEAKTAKGTPIRINHRLASAGSVLVQTYGAAGPRQTLTLFHLDGARLLATHYCAQGNQPRLRLDASGKDGVFVFSFLDATNLADPRASHMRRLRIELLDPEHFLLRETYAADGKEDTTVLAFARIP